MEIQKDLEKHIKFVQDTLASFPAIILGSGYSAAFGMPGMPELAKYLIDVIPDQVDDTDKDEWGKIKIELESNSLEIALQKIKPSAHLHDLIIAQTWNCVFPKDVEIFREILKSSLEMPLGRLIEYLFRSTHQRISIITTNYDRLAEYAVDFKGYGRSTGFKYGYLGERYNKQFSIVKSNSHLTRMVDIWKVHGSLDWFRTEEGKVYNLPSMVEPIGCFKPLIVTPGVEKYRITHEEPFRSIITGADFAIENANSFLCIGYGFNDDHIQSKLLERCTKDGKRIVVLAKELTPSAKKFLLDKKCPSFLAVEEAKGGTKFYSNEFVDGVEFESINLWDFGDLLKLVI